VARARSRSLLGALEPRLERVLPLQLVGRHGQDLAAGAAAVRHNAAHPQLHILGAVQPTQPAPHLGRGLRLAPADLRPAYEGVRLEPPSSSDRDSQRGRDAAGFRARDARGAGRGAHARLEQVPGGGGGDGRR